MCSAVTAERAVLGLPAVFGVPHLAHAATSEPVRGDDGARPTHDDAVVVDDLADLDSLPEAGWRHRVTHAAPLDQRQRDVHAARLDICGVEPGTRQRPQEPLLGLQPLQRRLTRRAVHHRPGPSSEPLLSTYVQLRDIGGRAEHIEFFEERLLQRPERPLDLPLAFRVAGLAGRDLDAVITSELECRWVQAEPLALRTAERTHPVRAHRARHATDMLEEAAEPFEGVLTVDAVGEPPPHQPRPAQDRAEALQLVAPSPAFGPIVAVGPIKLALLTRSGLDRHAHRRCRPEPRAAHGPHVTRDRRVRAVKPLGLQDVEDARRQQARLRAEQLVDPLTPSRVEHPLLVSRHPSRRRTAVLVPLRDRRWVIPQPLADLLERQTLIEQTNQVHVLLLRHHRNGPSGAVGAWQLDTLEGPPPRLVDRQEEPEPTATFTDRRSRESVTAHIRQMSRPAGWVYVAAVRYARRRRRGTVTQPIGSAHDHADQVAVGRDLAVMLDTLPPRQRLAVTLRYLCDLPIAEVASAMGCAVGTAKATLHAALANMRVDHVDSEVVTDAN